MTSVGRLAAIVAVALGVVTVATWNDSTESIVSSDAPLDGAMLFKSKGCASCHFGPDMNSGFSIGPSLKSAAVWAGDRRPGMSAADYLAESMRTPSAFISPAFTGGQGPMTGMPNLNLSEAEINALVVYLLR